MTTAIDTLKTNYLLLLKGGTTSSGKKLVGIDAQLDTVPGLQPQFKTPLETEIANLEAKINAASTEKDITSIQSSFKTLIKNLEHNVYNNNAVKADTFWDAALGNKAPETHILFTKPAKDLIAAATPADNSPAPTNDAANKETADKFKKKTGEAAEWVTKNFEKSPWLTAIMALGAFATASCVKDIWSGKGTDKFTAMGMALAMAGIMYVTSGFMDDSPSKGNEKATPNGVPPAQLAMAKAPAIHGKE